MEIKEEKNGSELTVKLVGRLDTTTSPDLEKYLGPALKGVTSLVFDFSELEYISSAGLRVLLSTVKVMNNQGSMVVRNANDMVKEVFEVTGFLDIIHVE